MNSSIKLKLVALSLVFLASINLSAANEVQKLQTALQELQTSLKAVAGSIKKLSGPHGLGGLHTKLNALAHLTPPPVPGPNHGGGTPPPKPEIPTLTKKSTLKTWDDLTGLKKEDWPQIIGASFSSNAPKGSPDGTKSDFQKAATIAKIAEDHLKFKTWSTPDFNTFYEHPDLSIKQAYSNLSQQPLKNAWKAAFEDAFTEEKTPASDQPKDNDRELKNKLKNSITAILNAKKQQTYFYTLLTSLEFTKDHMNPKAANELSPEKISKNLYEKIIIQLVAMPQETINSFLAGAPAAKSTFGTQKTELQKQSATLSDADFRKDIEKIIAKLPDPKVVYAATPKAPAPPNFKKTEEVKKEDPDTKKPIFKFLAVNFIAAIDAKNLTPYFIFDDPDEDKNFFDEISTKLNSDFPEQFPKSNTIWATQVYRQLKKLDSDGKTYPWKEEETPTVNPTHTATNTGTEPIPPAPPLPPIKKTDADVASGDWYREEEGGLILKK